MRTPFAISRTARLLGATLALALTAAPAHAADAPFTPRFAQTARGDVAAVGNTVMTCPVGAANCAAAQGGAAYSNNDFAMAYVDADADPATTVDSSSATVTLPAGATVLLGRALLERPTLAARRRDADKATAQGPGGGSYQQRHRRPGRLPHLHGAVDPLPRLRATSPRRWRRPAAGTYWVGDVQAGTGTDRFAGWALFVAYRDNAQPIRRLNVYDGLGTVDGRTPSRPPSRPSTRRPPAR